MKFRKKPVVVEAEQYFFVGNPNPHPEVKQRLKKMPWGEPVLYYYIETLEGPMQVHQGDWIVKGIAGEFYPVRDDIFRASYEPVEECVE